MKLGNKSVPWAGVSILSDRLVKVELSFIISVTIPTPTHTVLSVTAHDLADNTLISTPTVSLLGLYKLSICSLDKYSTFGKGVKFPSSLSFYPLFLSFFCGQIADSHLFTYFRNSTHFWNLFEGLLLATCVLLSFEKFWIWCNSSTWLSKPDFPYLFYGLYSYMCFFMFKLLRYVSLFIFWPSF